jgi:sigma-B regulation protein RsbU (phosphoserine phosphatase)
MLRNLRDWMRVRSSLTLAMEIQRRLLPSRPPNVSGFDIAGYCAYCDETGGDYYDYIVFDRSNRQRFIVALGDVMGHGLASALLMASARGILRSSISAFSAPGAILTHLNARLYEDTGGERFMTMCLAAFDIQSPGLVWTSAGHDAPIIYNPVEKNFIELDGGELPLGIMPDVEYGNYQFGPICRDTIIVMGSDGVWDTFAENGDRFGKDRLRNAIAAHAGGTAEEIKQAILRELDTFRGAFAIKDDVTFVVIKGSHVQANVP